MKNVISRRAFSTGVAAVTAASIVGGTPNSAQAKVVLKYANGAGAKSNPAKFAFKLFEEISKRSNGEIQFQTFFGTLGSEKKLIDGLALGTIDMVTTGYSGTREFDICYSPFMFRDAEHAGKVINGPLRKHVSKVMSDRYNAKFLGVARDGPFSLFTKQKIEALSDLKGRKIRAGKIEGVVAGLQHVGARPTVVPFNEVYTSLSQGVVDGMVTLLNLALIMKFNEVVKYVARADWGIGLGKWTIGRGTWDKLSPEHQKLIQSTFDEMEANVYYPSVINQFPIDYANWEKANGPGTVMNIDTAAAQKYMEPLNEKLADEVFGPGTWKIIQNA
jgi:TRAP-type C4-dicarboxylate transport system substrate-binding protein